MTQWQILFMLRLLGKPFPNLTITYLRMDPAEFL